MLPSSRVSKKNGPGKFPVFSSLFPDLKSGHRGRREGQRSGVVSSRPTTRTGGRMASQEGNRIDLMTLPPQQLAQLKEQLEQQIEQFSMNFQDLQNAISGFHSSGLAIEDLSRQKEGERVSENRADVIRCDAPCASHLSRTPTTTLPTFGGNQPSCSPNVPDRFFFSFFLSLSLSRQGRAHSPDVLALRGRHFGQP